MSLVTGEILEEAGWAAGPEMVALLERARVYEEEKGIVDVKYLLKLLRRDFGEPAKAMRMRATGLLAAEAIEASSEEEVKNLVRVRRQMREMLRVPVVKAGAVMPDACPAGAGVATIPVGGAIAVEGAIVPGAHGADICCSMYASFYRSDGGVGGEMDVLVGATRFGAGGRSVDEVVHHPVVDEEVWENVFLKGLRDKAVVYLADQGDGNHFAFLGEVVLGEREVAVIGKSRETVKAGRYRVLVTHHGSRGLGAAVFKRGQAAAEKHTARVAEGVPAGAAWLDAGDATGAAYWEALQYVGRWTRANHEAIHRRFLDGLGAVAAWSFGNEHNFVWQRDGMFLHGKGATPAWKGDDGKPLLGLVPMNMRDGVLVVLGGDNTDFLSFAPHGAGRNVSRRRLVRRTRKRAHSTGALRHSRSPSPSPSPP
ncbi:MAG: RtcB family protein, partial [Verrucomicrobiales bacterium]|nr:RtcB family protein [Verrucomicrobiales bacterium]